MKEKISKRIEKFIIIIFLTILLTIAQDSLLPPGSPILEAAVTPEKMTDSAQKHEMPPGSELTDNKRAEFVSNKFIIKFKDNVEPAPVLRSAGIDAPAIQRVFSIGEIFKRFKKDYKLDRDSNGWHPFLGKNYKEVDDMPDEDVFRRVYSTLPKAIQALRRTYKVELPKGANIDLAIAELSNDAAVEYAEPNYIAKIQMMPNDPYYYSSGILTGLTKTMNYKPYSIRRNGVFCMRRTR